MRTVYKKKIIEITCTPSEMVRYLYENNYKKSVKLVSEYIEPPEDVLFSVGEDMYRYTIVLTEDENEVEL